MSPAARTARADTWLPWFDVQLRFAGRQAELSGLTLGAAVAEYTTLHRRFGLGRIHGQPSDPAWFEFTAGLAACADDATRLDWTRRCFIASRPEQDVLSERHFGCFSYDAPDAHGVVRIHFLNREPGGSSPLASRRVGARRAELRAMFAHVVAHHPGATTIRGTSWLYHLEAYRRLFPPEYGASRRLAPAGPRYQGYSNWGQFLTHTGALQLDRLAALRTALPRLEPTAPWRVFPLPALLTEAPLQAFLGWYAEPQGA